MRGRWKEVGLGFVVFMVYVLAVVAAQLTYAKYLPKVAAPVAIAVTVLLVYLVGARWIERRRLSEFASGRAARETVAGLALGFALFSATIAILWVMGVYHFLGWGSLKGVAAALAFAVMAGVSEELMFRGLLFRLSSKIVGTWGALLFTSALFGLAHIANHGATLTSSLAIMLEAGILLGAAYAVTGRLWLPIGLHIAWNFTEGFLFGMSVSGTTVTSALTHGSLSGPQLLTGGAFGPEASVMAVMVCLLVAGYLLFLTVRRGRIELPAWSRHAQPVIAALQTN